MRRARVGRKRRDSVKACVISGCHAMQVAGGRGYCTSHQDEMASTAIRNELRRTTQQRVVGSSRQPKPTIATSVSPSTSLSPGSTPSPSSFLARKSSPHQLSFQRPSRGKAMVAQLHKPGNRRARLSHNPYQAARKLAKQNTSQHVAISSSSPSPSPSSSVVSPGGSSSVRSPLSPQSPLFHRSGYLHSGATGFLANLSLDFEDDDPHHNRKDKPGDLPSLRPSSARKRGARAIPTRFEGQSIDQKKKRGVPNNYTPNSLNSSSAAAGNNGLGKNTHNLTSTYSHSRPMSAKGRLRRSSVAKCRVANCMALQTSNGRGYCEGHYQEIFGDVAPIVGAKRQLAQAEAKEQLLRHPGRNNNSSTSSSPLTSSSSLSSKPASSSSLLSVSTASSTSTSAASTPLKSPRTLAPISSSPSLTSSSSSSSSSSSKSKRTNHSNNKKIAKHHRRAPSAVSEMRARRQQLMTDAEEAALKAAAENKPAPPIPVGRLHRRRQSRLMEQLLMRPEALDLVKKHILIEASEAEEEKKVKADKKNKLNNFLMRRPSIAVLNTKRILVDHQETERRRANLSSLLASRHSARELKHMGILKDREDSVASRKKAEKLLSSLMANRPQKEVLERKGILKSDSPEAAQDRISKAKQLSKLLLRRPSMKNLITNNLLKPWQNVSFLVKQNKLAGLLAKRPMPGHMIKHERKKSLSISSLAALAEGVDGDQDETTEASVLAAINEDINENTLTDNGEIPMWKKMANFVETVVAKERKEKKAQRNKEQAQAKMEKGGLYMWGTASDGELGFGDTKRHPELGNVEEPTLMKALTRSIVTSVSCGTNHTLVLTENGYLYAWGGNERGQLGLGDTVNRPEPYLLKIRASPIYEKHARLIGAGDKFSAMIAKEGQMYMWGKTDHGVLGIGDYGDDTMKTLPTLIPKMQGDKIVCLSLGFTHAAALTTSGRLYTWGDNSRGQLGFADAGAEGFKVPTFLRKYHEFWDTVCCGNMYTFAVGFDRNVYGWGANDHGQLGVGELKDKQEPYNVPSLERVGIDRIRCGHSHTLALTEDGELFSSTLVNNNAFADTVTLNSNFQHVANNIIDACSYNVSGESIGINANGELSIWCASTGALKRNIHTLEDHIHVKAIASGDNFLAAISSLPFPRRTLIAEEKAALNKSIRNSVRASLRSSTRG